MIPNNTKSGIISIIRFSGEKKHSTFSAASVQWRFRVNAVPLPPEKPPLPKNSGVTSPAPFQSVQHAARTKFPGFWSCRDAPARGQDRICTNPVLPRCYSVIGSICSFREEGVPGTIGFLGKREPALPPSATAKNPCSRYPFPPKKRRPGTETGLLVPGRG